MAQTKLRLGFIGTMTGGQKGAYDSMGQIIAEHFDKEGFPVIVSSNKVNKLMRLFDIIETLCAQHKKIDILIIQVYSGVSFVIVEIASWLGKFFNLPMIFHMHGGNIPSFMDKYPFWTMRVFKRATMIVAPSHYLVHSLSQHGFNISLIPNVIDLPRYNFKHRRKVMPKILWLRAFHKVYNPALAAHTLSELNKMGISAQLTMAGPDKKDGSLKELLKVADEHKITQQIQIAGSIPNCQVPQYISQCDIFLNTTNVDNTPVSIIEAMACGLCIVSTNVGGIPYLLVDEKDALLVPPDDPKAMADAILRILTEPGLAGKLSMNARKKAEQFDWSVILPQWERLFLSIYGA